MFKHLLGIEHHFPDDSEGKESTCNAGHTRDMGSIPGLERFPGEGNGNSLQYSCLGNPMMGRLAGYSPQGLRESDMTEQLKHNEEF